MTERGREDKERGQSEAVQNDNGRCSWWFVLLGNELNY